MLRGRATGSRCESGAVLATVTGERLSTAPLGHLAWEGGRSCRPGSQETVCGVLSADPRVMEPQMSVDDTVMRPHQPSVDHSDRRVPINLRQSGLTPVQMLISTRIRKSPYWHLSMEAGCWRAEVYNRVHHPRGYVKPEDGGAYAEYDALVNHVTLWNVAVERQIQVKGPDGEAFVNFVITRDATKMPVMRPATSSSATRPAGSSTTRCCCASPRTSSGSACPTPTCGCDCRASTSASVSTSRSPRSTSVRCRSRGPSRST